KNLDLRLVFHDEFVDADYDLLLALDGHLILVGGIVNLALGESLFDRRNHAAQRIEPVKIFPTAFLHIQRQPFQEIRTGEWIYSIRDTCFVSDDLLSSKRDAGSVSGR